MEVLYWGDFSFRVLWMPQTILSEQQVRVLERLVVIMYSRKEAPSGCQPYTAVHVFLRCQKDSEYSASPSGPVTTCQEGRISSRSCLGANTTTYPGTYTSADWGCYISSDGWIPTWSTRPEASKACNELIKGGCKSACKCTKANLPCTALCTCNGSCYQEWQC